MIDRDDVISMLDKASMMAPSTEDRLLFAMAVKEIRASARVTPKGVVEAPPGSRIVCLCGSTRFAARMNEVAIELTLRGWIVVRPEVVAYSRTDDLQFVDPATKAMLDNLHLRKIDIASLVVVVNERGYIGESTRNEIAYANSTGKKVVYLESWGEIGAGA